MINRTILVGRITRDPELRKTQNGNSVVSFTVACNRRFGDQDQADFINCVAWNQSADFLANYIKKGALLGVEGRIQSRTYENREGQTVYVQEVVCDTVQALEPRNARTQDYDPGYQPDVAPSFSQTQSANNRDDEEPILDITNDDLPF